MLRRAPRALGTLSLAPLAHLRGSPRAGACSAVDRRRERGRKRTGERARARWANGFTGARKEFACAGCACPCALPRSWPAWHGTAGRRRMPAVATRTLRLRTPARRSGRRWPEMANRWRSMGQYEACVVGRSLSPAHTDASEKRGDGRVWPRNAPCRGQPALPSALASCMLPQSASRALRRSGQWRSGAVPLGVKGWKDDSRTRARQWPGATAPDNRRRTGVPGGRRTHVASPAHPRPAVEYVPLAVPSSRGLSSPRHRWPVTNPLNPQTASR